MLLPTFLVIVFFGIKAIQYANGMEYLTLVIRFLLVVYIDCI